jgi:hypothetical protein
VVAKNGEERLAKGSLLFILVALGSSSGTLALDTARTTTTIMSGKREVDVLLGVETNDERRTTDMDYLPSGAQKG